MKKIIPFLILTAFLFLFETQVSATSTTLYVKSTIGKNHFSLFGQSSPNALIRLEGLGLYEETLSDTTGHFEFNHRLAPFTQSELCLTAQDSRGVTSNPICLPPVDFSSDNRRIGPIIMPPTIYLSKINVKNKSFIIVAGQSIPYADVKISIISNSSIKSSFFDHAVSTVYAEAPNYYFVPTDSGGNYRLELPKNQELSSGRVFSQVKYNNELSYQSTTLAIKERNIMIELLIKLAVFVEIFLMASFFIRRYLHPLAIVKNKRLVFR